MNSLLRTAPEVIIGPEPLAPRVVSVAAVSDSTIEVAFETGEVRRVDVAPLFGRGVFRCLREPERFEEVSVVPGGGGVEWACGPDLSANRLYFGPDPAWKRAP